MLTQQYAKKILEQLFTNAQPRFLTEGGDTNVMRKYPTTNINDTVQAYYGTLVNLGDGSNAFFNTTGIPTLYLGLLTRLPTSSSSYVEMARTAQNATTHVMEDTGYSRVPLHSKDIFNGENYILKSAATYTVNGVLSPYCITNAADIVFPAPTATQPWAGIVGFGIFTGATNSDLILWGEFDEPITVNTSEILKISKTNSDPNDPRGSFIIEFD